MLSRSSTSCIATLLSPNCRRTAPSTGSTAVGPTSRNRISLARDLKATWAADAVAGSMTGILAACMPSGSTIAVYGVLSGAESMVNPGDLIFRGQSVTGYWVSREFQDRSPLGLLRIWRFLRSARRLLTTDLQSKAQAS